MCYRHRIPSVHEGPSGHRGPRSMLRAIQIVISITPGASANSMAAAGWTVAVIGKGGVM